MDSAQPDICVSSPFPYPTVFEAKYYSGASNAVESLVKAIHEAFLYRSLPPATGNKNKMKFDYNFACAVIYDASADSKLKKAWEQIPLGVRDSFWKGANTYIIILPK